MIRRNTIHRSLCASFISFYILFGYLHIATGASIRIASGTTNGSYYPVALQICDLINKHNAMTKCEVVISSGAIHNVALLQAETVDFAIVQSDFCVDAINATGIFSGETPFRDFRFVLSLFNEHLTIIAKDDSSLVTFSDFSGRKIGLNLNGSGTKTGLMTLFKYFNFLESPRIIHVQEEDMVQKLCDGNVEAIALFTGHPSILVNDIANACNVEFISVDPIKLDNITAMNPLYKSSILSPNSYNNISHAVNTISARSIVVTSAKVEQNKVDILTNTIKKYFEDFQKSYPLLENLTKKEVFESQYYNLPSY